MHNYIICNSLRAIIHRSNGRNIIYTILLMENRIFSIGAQMETTAEQIAEFRKYFEEHKDQKDKPDDMSDAEFEDWEG